MNATSALTHYLGSLSHAQRRQLAAAETEWRLAREAALRVLAAGWAEYEGLQS